MKEYKRIIVGFRVRENQVTSWDGKLLYEGELSRLAAMACDNGADELWLTDDSATDEEHEAVIGRIRVVSRVVDVPILTGGRVRRLEDIKKYLYAGASAVFLDGTSPENVDLIKEGADRFGSEKIGVYLAEEKLIARAAEFVQLGASQFALAADLSAITQTARDFLENAPVPCLCFHSCRPQEDRAGLLAPVLKIPQVSGVILSVEESQLTASMELKQDFKQQGIPVDTFESAVEWKDFKLNSDGLIPVIVQDYRTSQVLMMAYMNEEAFLSTLHSGRMTYYSRSRKCQWLKGETSGHFQYVKSLKLDCDNDTLLAEVNQIGAACHTGSRSCFFQTLAEKEHRETNPLKVFQDVFEVIQDRKEHPKEGSYTNYLFDKGIDKILKKLGEEATEIVIAAKNPNPEEVKYEIADFLYHMMVLMAEKKIAWEDITEELANR